jgi:hypothetical protein
MESSSVARENTPGQGRRGRGRRIAFWLITLAILFVFVEICGFAATQLAPQLFDRRDAVLARLTPEGFERFRVSRASRTLGWENPAAATRQIPNCGHVDITYTYDADRLRVHGPTTLGDAVVLAAGDSFTHGDEVDDQHTFPAVLERSLGVPVANLGVGGYGPDQALLRLESLIDRAPRARVMVLAIMNEDAERMLNSYRPALTGRYSELFTLKPYLRDGEFIPIPGGDPFRSFETMRAAVIDAFDHDFWARPRAGFPYSVAFVRAVLAPANRYPVLNQLAMTTLGWERNHLIYRFPPVRRDLQAVFARFARLAQAHNLGAVVAFIPQDYADRDTGDLGIAAATEEQRRAIRFINVGGDFDWSNFNGPTCHPNANGYRMIADDIARAVRPLLAP